MENLYLNHGYLAALISPWLIGYFIGSIPFGLILTKMAGYGDIRTIGSGNIGATNVLRTGNKKLAALTVLMDAGKGALAVFTAYPVIFYIISFFANNSIAWFGPYMFAACGVSAVLGHMFPVWLKFKGGKGVATSFGVILALCWPAGLLGFVTWLVVAFVTRISSFSALITAALAPLYLYLIAPNPIEKVIAVGIIALLVIVKHHANIRRLLNGTEPKISFGSKAKQETKTE